MSKNKPDNIDKQSSDVNKTGKDIGQSLSLTQDSEKEMNDIVRNIDMEAIMESYARSNANKKEPKKATVTPDKQTNELKQKTSLGNNDEKLSCSSSDWGSFPEEAIPDVLPGDKEYRASIDSSKTDTKKREHTNKNNNIQHIPKKVAKEYLLPKNNKTHQNHQYTQKGEIRVEHNHQMHCSEVEQGLVEEIDTKQKHSVKTNRENNAEHNNTNKHYGNKEASEHTSKVFPGQLPTIRNRKYDESLKGDNLNCNVEIIKLEESYQTSTIRYVQVPSKLVEMTKDVLFAKKCFFEASCTRMHFVAKLESMRRNKLSYNPYCDAYRKLQNEEAYLPRYDGVVTKNSSSLNKIMNEYRVMLQKWIEIKQLGL